MQSTESVGLYIHVPFCAQKCYYCAFFSEAQHEQFIPDYFGALKQEFALYLSQLKHTVISSIYFGGGTPSLVNPSYIADLLSIFRQELKLVDQIEITLEANPESITKQKLTAYADAGINRLSIGLQAWQPHILKALNRPYQLDTFLEIYQLVQQSAIKNYNLDLMFGLPNQTLAEWQESLESTIELKPNHISCYSLEVDNHSLFGRQARQGQLSIPTESLDRKMYALAKKLLRSAGYQHYELSNFALPKFESSHNNNFWHNKPYLGLGASAASCWQNQEWENVAHTASYIKLLSQQNSPIQQKTQLAPSDQLIAAIALGLRLTEGIDLTSLIAQYLPKAQQHNQTIINTLISDKLLQTKGSHILLTDKGQDIADTVIAKVISCL